MAEDGACPCSDECCNYGGELRWGSPPLWQHFGQLFDQGAFFDADQCVGELLTSGGICEKIGSEFGSAVLDSNGNINRTFLRHQVFDSAERRAALESILHPEVYKCYLEFTQEALASSAEILFADVPLLFETGKKYVRDLVVVVACDRQTQLDRLQSRSGN